MNSNGGTEGSHAASDEAFTAPSVHHVTEQLYADLAEQADKSRGNTLPSDPSLALGIAAFLFWEARLLDGRRYRDWVKLLTDDCIYWVPSNAEGHDLRLESAINFDDRRRILDRIALIESGALHAQIPPSRTCRMITNVETWPGQSGQVKVRSNTAIWEHRRGTTHRFIGWQEHELVAEAKRWLIKTKIINLIDCDQPQGNITFIL
jgi:3-phenylpropionate/cinnamic acid dioxygenase small subunit